VSTVLLEAPLGLPAARPGGRPTLAELLDGTWRRATTEGQADCPICHAAMHAEAGAAGARCESCGTTLT
jgi:hypothetical protein